MCVCIGSGTAVSSCDNSFCDLFHCYICCLVNNRFRFKFGVYAYRMHVSPQIALVERGGSSFAEKVRKLQTLGAIAVIVSQNCDVWPYTMQDSATGGEGCSIPAVM